MQIIVLSSMDQVPKALHITRRVMMQFLLWLFLMCVLFSILFYHLLWSNPVFLSWLTSSRFVQYMPVYHASLQLSPYEQTALKDRMLLVAQRLQVLEDATKDIHVLLHVDLSSLNQQAMDSDFNEETPVISQETSAPVSVSPIVSKTAPVLPAQLSAALPADDEGSD